LNHIQKSLLIFAYSIFNQWKQDFATKPEVWVGIGKPMKQLTPTQAKIAKIAVTVAAVALEYFLYHNSANDESW